MYTYTSLKHSRNSHLRRIVRNIPRIPLCITFARHSCTKQNCVLLFPSVHLRTRESDSLVCGTWYAMRRPHYHLQRTMSLLSCNTSSRPFGVQIALDLGIVIHCIQSFTADGRYLFSHLLKPATTRDHPSVTSTSA